MKSQNRNKTTYEMFKDGIQFLAFIVASVFTLGGIWTHVSAYDDRIRELEIWRIEQASDMATVKQKVTDIHDFLLPLGKHE